MTDFTLRRKGENWGKAARPPFPNFPPRPTTTVVIARNDKGVTKQPHNTLKLIFAKIYDAIKGNLKENSSIINCNINGIQTQDLASLPPPHISVFSLMRINCV